MSIDVIMKGGTVVSHQGIERKDIAVRDGIIVAMGNLQGLPTKSEVDVTNLHILPGVIDTDLHLRDMPDSELKAAVCGGVTSALIFGTINENTPIDFASYLEITKENIDEIISREMNEGIAGIYVSMSDTNSLISDKDLHKLLKKAKRRVSIHAEDFYELEKRKDNIIRGKVESHPIWHDEKVSVEATRRILAIARGAGHPVHLMHLSSAKELGMIAAYKELATASLSPHHLFLSAPECYKHFHEYAQFDPPIRDEENRIGLWKALTSGIVDMVSSFHIPVTTNNKENVYPDSISGAPSVQSMLPLMLDQVNRGSLSLNTLIDLTSAGPARVFNIARKGRIAVGYDADFVICDLKKKWIFEDGDVESGCGWDHHAGMEIIGKVKGTMIRGEFAMWDGKLTNNTKGKTVQFTDTFIEYEDE